MFIKYLLGALTLPLIVAACVLGVHLTTPPTVHFDMDHAERATVMVVDDSGGGGSGVIVGPRLVLTANHVVQGEDHVTVTNFDGAKVLGVTVWASPSQDLALVQLSSPLAGPKATISCQPLAAGDLVIAVGHPLLVADWSITWGKVASDKPVINPESGNILVALDLSLMPGNSGGPIFDREGRVVAISDAVLVSQVGQGGIALGVPMGSLCASLPVSIAAR